MAHGMQKWLGFPVPPPSPVTLTSLAGAAGLLELVGGPLILIGLFTRPVAFVLSGLMAFAYFIAHAPGGFWPIVNRGELAALYSFVFLYLAAAGGGPWSVDSLAAQLGNREIGATTACSDDANRRSALTGASPCAPYGSAFALRDRDSVWPRPLAARGVSLIHASSKCIAHGEHHGSDKDAEEAEREKTADHPREDQQQRQIGALLDQHRAEEIVERADEYRPDEQQRSPYIIAGPVQPDRRRQQNERRSELGDTEQQHDGRQHARKGNARHRQTEPAEERLDEGCNHHAERDTAYRPGGEQHYVFAPLARKPGAEFADAERGSFPPEYMTAAMTTVSRNCTTISPMPPASAASHRTPCPI